MILHRTDACLQGHSARGLSGQTGLTASRLAIEAEVRRSVLALPNVELLSGIEVIEPGFEAGRVTGVRVAALHDRSLPADLVIDGTGRAAWAAPRCDVPMGCSSFPDLGSWACRSLQQPSPESG